jgi:hypothetical protein
MEEILIPTEFESTISIPIDREEFTRAKGNTDVIFLFNDGLRMSERRIEKKITISVKRVFGFYEGFIYPISRTSANETPMAINEYSMVSKVIHRIIRKLPNGIRVSYNKEELEKGERYNVEYEIEYAQETPYSEIVALERELMSAAAANNHYGVTISMKLDTIFACVMTKVQLWHLFNENEPYLWAYKWNGVKAKLMIDENEKIAYVWPDASNISAVPFRGYHKFLKNLCFLVELMEDRIVIIEVIGSKFWDNQTYMTEPITNVNILRYLNDITIMEDGKTTMYVDNKPLIVQKFYDPPKAETYDKSLYDGIIIVQNEEIIKWKMPTVDVKCTGPYTYVVANEVLKLSEHGIKDAIYEISPMYKIIRRRTDRIACSTEKEFQVFLKSVDLLSK